MTGRYEMLVEQNADVPMRDGAILRANVYRPHTDGRFPVLMTFGPYGKDVPLWEFMQEALDRLKHDLSGDPGSFFLQAPRLRAAGPRNVGSGRLHSYQRGLSCDQPPLSGPGGMLGLRLAVALAWAEPVGVAQPATRRMRARIPLVLVACIRSGGSSLPVTAAYPSATPPDKAG
jgi:hypothetical protein